MVYAVVVYDFSGDPKTYITKKTTLIYMANINFFGLSCFYYFKRVKDLLGYVERAR